MQRAHPQLHVAVSQLVEERIPEDGALVQHDDAIDQALDVAQQV